jgi:hypothetical protein
VLEQEADGPGVPAPRVHVEPVDDGDPVLVDAQEQGDQHRRVEDQGHLRDGSHHRPDDLPVGLWAGSGLGIIGGLEAQEPCDLAVPEDKHPDDNQAALRRGVSEIDQDSRASASQLTRVTKTMYRVGTRACSCWYRAHSSL